MSLLGYLYPSTIGEKAPNITFSTESASDACENPGHAFGAWLDGDCIGLVTVKCENSQGKGHFVVNRDEALLYGPSWVIELLDAHYNLFEREEN